MSRLHAQTRQFRLIGGPHNGETYAPVKNGKGLPQLLSRTCELAGGLGSCRSTYSYDARARVYRFASQQVQGIDKEAPAAAES